MPDPPTVEVRDASLEAPKLDGWIILYWYDFHSQWHTDCFVYSTYDLANESLQISQKEDGNYAHARIVHVADRVEAQQERVVRVCHVDGCHQYDYGDSAYCKEHQLNG